MLLVRAKRDLDPSDHLRLIDALDETSTHVTTETPPFEFNILDTPNRGIARTVTLLAIACDAFRRAMVDGSIEELEKAKNAYEDAFPIEGPLASETKRLERILQQKNIIDVIYMIMDYEKMTRPPATLTLTQHKELAKVLSGVYFKVPKDVIGWSKGGIGWVNRQTMRNFAHHIYSTLDVEQMSCKTTAGRLAETLSLLEASGFGDDGIGVDAKRRLDSGYRFELGDYKLRHVDDVLSGRVYKAATNSA